MSIRNKVTRLFQKILLVFLYGFVVLNLLILVSGRSYLYDGFFNIYLKGKTVPDIFDLSDGNAIRVIRGQSDKQNKMVEATALPPKNLAFFSKYQTESFIVYKNDTICYEWYKNTGSKHMVSNSFSMAKSLVSLLIGIAIADKEIKSLDEPVKNYIPSFASHGRSSITIRNLLTMSSGLDWRESPANPFSENAEAYYSADVNSIVMHQRLVQSPGKEFIYQSGNTQLLALVLKKATGRSLSVYANQKIWRFLRPEDDVYWGTDKSGQEKAFCCVYASPRDYVKLGQMLLKDGYYKGKQIVPKSYLAQAFSPIPMMTKYITPNHRYGFQFWVYNDGNNQMKYFHGLQGQYIMVFPKEEMIIVRTGHKRSEEYGVGEFFKNLNRMDIQANYEHIGHPVDLFKYINIARKAIKDSHEVK